MKDYIDIHTHSQNKCVHIDSIYNYDFTKKEDLYLNQKFTMGLHPWFINQVDLNRVFENIKDNLNNKNFMGMGEIGLDRKSDLDFDLQKEILIKQLQFAKDHNIKNIIFHCVRAYNDIIQIIKETAYHEKFIFHDYNGSVETTKSLLKYPCYFSLGKRIFLKKEKQSFILNQHQARLFLETDEDSLYSIEKIYECAAQEADLSLCKIQEIIQFNFNNCFDAPIKL